MTDDLYTTIRISTLRGDRPIGFDVFVRVGDRFVAYCRRGTTFDGERLARLQNKKIKELYIMRTDQYSYDIYVNESVEAAYRPGQPLKTRVEVIAGAQQANGERLMENPTDEKIYLSVRDSAERFVKFLAEEPFAPGFVLGFANSTQSISQHSVNVATIATAMLIKQNATLGPAAHLMVVGCLLHDVDHYRSGRDVAARPDALTPEALAAYRQHPNRGAQLFQSSAFIDQLVIQIISQHEETMDGSGYPRHLIAAQMDPMVLTAAVANAYDRLVSFDGLAPREALKHLLIDKLGEYPLASLKTLQSILKLHDLV